MKTLKNTGKNDINFEYEIEELKWEAVIELICHEDYKDFLMAIRKKSKLIKEILKELYEMFYY